jgi:hypothetical protein
MMMQADDEIAALKFTISRLERDLAKERNAKYDAEHRAIEMHGKMMEHAGALRTLLTKTRDHLVATHGLEIRDAGAPDDSGIVDNSFQIADINAVLQAEPDTWIKLHDAEKDKEIAELKDDLQTVNQDFIASTQAYIKQEDELKAHINLMREALQKFIDRWRWIDQSDVGERAVYNAIEVLRNTPAQSLAERDAELTAAKDKRIAELEHKNSELLVAAKLPLSGWQKAEADSETRRAEGLFNDNCTLRLQITEKDAHINRMRVTLALIAADGSRYPHLLAKETLKIIPAQSLAEHDAEKDRQIEALSRSLKYFSSETYVDAVKLIATQQGRKAIADATQEVHLVFERSDRFGPLFAFIEAEDASGKSINLGEWTKRDDGYFELVLKVLRKEGNL